jgi:ribosome-binding protein aMBF1 (putative translation factor)
VADRNLSFYEHETDDLEAFAAERTARNPEFPALVAEARERRAFLRALGAERKRLKISQVIVAKRMGTSQPFVSRLERGEIDPQHGTEDRYAAALGLKIQRVLVPRG